MGRAAPLLGSPYETRDPIRAAQRCVNLYGEKLGPDAPFPFRFWPMPGLRVLGTAPNGSGFRCVYTASNGDLFAVAGNTVYFVSSDLKFNQLGTVLERTSPAYMADNGLCVVLVDGSAAGYVINLADHSFGGISDQAFFGADRVDYVDTYFVFNRPGTNQWYISLSEATYAMLTAQAGFDSLDVAGKTGGADKISSIVVKRREVWLIGAYTSEVWYDAGSADFAFAEIPGSFIDHGIVARHSLAREDVSLFWLSQDKEGQGIVVRSENYDLKRISTYAIEADLRTYSRIDDAIGFCFQQNGHAFYALSFPSGDKTWLYDLAADLWSEWMWTDDNGAGHRHRANCHTFAYGQNVVGDWQNGNLYALDSAALTDNGRPIQRLRTFPHMQAGGDLVSYIRFIADIQVGADVSAGVLGEASLSLRYSADRGGTWSDPLINSLGKTGEYHKQVDWWQLGCGRDYVFELSWTAPVQAALNGAYVEAEKHAA